MFGLEGQKKKKKSEEFVFEFEKEVLKPEKQKEVMERLEKRIQKIKDSLRGGENQEDFNQFGLLLQGYIALVKVMTRVSQKAKKAATKGG